MPSRRALLAAAPMLLTACASPSRIPEALASASLSPSASPSTTPPPPPRPSVAPPEAQPPAVKSVGWYLSQVPDFKPGPDPAPVDVPDGGTTPWWSRVPTSHKVAFITIDDGGMSRTTEALELIKQARIPVSLFLNSPAASNHTAYFQAIKSAGTHIQNHTVTHRGLKGQSYDFQRKEIEDCSNRLEELFGTRPHLFRPPFGEYDSVTLKAARDCGIRACFFWRQTVHEGVVRYQTAEKVVQPGDVMLMHFRPALADDLIGALRAMKESGLIPARLEDYVPRRAG